MSEPASTQNVPAPGTLKRAGFLSRIKTRFAAWKRPAPTRDLLWEGPPATLSRFRRYVWYIGAVFTAFAEVLKSLRHFDSGTRVAALLFITSLISGAAFGVLVIYRFSSDSGVFWKKAKESPEGSSSIKQLVEKQNSKSHHEATTLNLGVFTFDIDNKEEVRLVRAPTSFHLAEMEIVVQCEQAESCNYLQDHSAQARDRVTIILTHMQRQELLSKEGKVRLRRLLIDSLNQLIPSGRVTELYFSKLLIG